MTLDGFSFMFWLALAAGGYVFYAPFRRWVNGWLVHAADKIKSDADLPKAAGPQTEIWEELALTMYKEDHPDDPRIAGGWWALPEDIRKDYIVRAVKTFTPPAA